MPDTSVQEFVSKCLNDKAYLQEVMKNCWDVDYDGEDALGVTFGTAAQRMGMDFSYSEVDAEFKEQIKSHGVFGLIKFLHRVSKAQKQAKKAAGK